MDSQASELAQFLVERLESTPASSRLLVGLTGIPASGKSTFAARVVHRTNTLFRQESDLEEEGNPTGSTKGDVAILVGLDGWHLTRAQLDAFPEPQLAHDRRGAHWTFDGPAYVAFLRSLRAPLTSNTPEIHAPSFDHAVKDPAPESIHVLPSHRIVIIEGLYTFLSIEPWIEGAELLDERWLLSVDIEEAQARLVKRHVLSGVARDLKEAKWRAEENDMPNGQFILKNMLKPTRVIQSVNDPAA